MSLLSPPFIVWSCGVMSSVIAAMILATLNWSGQNAKLAWCDEHRTIIQLTFVAMMVPLGFGPFFGDWFDVWNHLWLLGAGTFACLPAFFIWRQALPTLNRLYSPSDEQVPPGTYPLDQRMATMKREFATPQLEVRNHEANS